MKLASLKHKKDGRLIVVSKDLTKGILVKDISYTMQEAIDYHTETFPKLTEIYNRLNQGSLPGEFLLKIEDLSAPLPRSYQWADGSAYLNHVELTRKARGAPMPEVLYHEPLMYQGASDYFLGPKEDIVALSEDFGIDFEAEIAVITSQVPMGVSEKEAEKYIILFSLVNDISLRNIIPKELEKGFGFFNGKPHSALSPVFVTPDELDGYFYEGKVHLPIFTHLNDKLFGSPDAGVDMNFNFFKLLSHAARTRPLMPGSIIGSGTVSNKDESVGSSCIIEKRMKEKINNNKIEMLFLQNNDTVKIEMLDKNGNSIFGKIEQKVKVA